MAKKVSLTGVKSTGIPHLGNYFGAIKPAIEMAKSGDYFCYYFIADYHSLTSVHDAKQFKQDTYEVAATWLACGLDPKEVCLYKQSDIPEILELNWILSCFTSKGLLNRAHAYKAKVQDNEEHGRDSDQNVNMGLFNYPTLMACDILFIGSDVVPIGADNLQHIEIARDIANSFNSAYKKTFKLPEPIVRKEDMVEGLDGRKMSKSYNNHIPLFLPPKQLKKYINKIKTDSSAPEDPKNPDECLIFGMFKRFASEDEAQALAQKYKVGIGWGDAKEQLFQIMERELAGPRQIYDDLINNKSKIDKILADGAARVRPRAADFLKRVKKTIGAL